MARLLGRRRRHPRTRGQALVETALVLPIFLLLMMTLFDFGRVIYAQNTINQDAREGVRKGIVSVEKLSTNLEFTTRFAEIRAAARAMSPAVPLTDKDITGDQTRKCSAVMGATGGTPLMPDDAVTPADPLVANSCFYPNGAVNTNAQKPAKVVVNIKVRVTFITPIISNILGGGIDVSAKAEQLIQS
jgi:Flp pilus assembly protein TadG